MFCSTVVRRAGLAVLAGAGVACGGGHRAAVSAPEVPPVVAQSLERKTLRTANQELVVDPPVVAGRRVEQLVTDAGGYIERSQSSTNGECGSPGGYP
jgi:hypothetical protein